MALFKKSIYSGLISKEIKHARKSALIFKKEKIEKINKKDIIKIFSLDLNYNLKSEEKIVKNIIKFDNIKYNNNKKQIFKNIYTLDYFKSLILTFNNNNNKFINNNIKIDINLCLKYNKYSIFKYIKQNKIDKYNFIFKKKIFKNGKFIKNKYVYINLILKEFFSKLENKINRKIEQQNKVHFTYNYFSLLKEEKYNYNKNKLNLDIKNDFDYIKSISNNKYIKKEKRINNDNKSLNNNKINYSNTKKFLNEKEFVRIANNLVLLKYILKIKNLINNRINKKFNNKYYEIINNLIINKQKINNNNIHEVDPQMETTKDTLEVNKTDNVIDVIQNTVIENIIPTVTDESFYASASTSDVIKLGGDYDGRLIEVRNFNWSTDDVNEKEILRLNLPVDVIKDNKHSPNFMMLMQHAYMQCDLELVIHLNSNNFQVGQLIVAWYPCAIFDKNYINKLDTAGMYQMQHILINAADKEDGKFTIPYSHYKAWLSIISRDTDEQALNLGTFIIKVNNQLKVASTTYKNIQGLVQFSMKSGKYTGLMSRNDVDSKLNEFEPQMLPLSKIVRIATNSLNQVLSDNNRDKPPNITPSIIHTPRAASSWATGTNDIDNVEMLRLDPSGQTPHPGINENDTSIKTICKKWGLIKKITWTRDNKRNTELFKTVVSPSLNFDNLPVCTTDETLRHMPPVTVMANMHCQWRGGLEYRFDFVNSSIQTGSVLIAFVPRIKVRNTVESLKNYYHAIVDISDVKSFIFKTPYIGDKPMWPRCEIDLDGNAGDVPIMGYLYVVVINQLSLMDSVPTSIDINILIRGGDDFELLVPCEPIYGPLYGKYVAPPIEYYPHNKQDGYSNQYLYFDTWRWIPDSRGILRYNTGTDQIMEFEGNFEQRKIYQIKQRRGAWNFVGANINGVIAYLNYFVMVKMTGYGGLYMSGFVEYKDAKRYHDQWKTIGYDKQSPLDYLLKIKEGYCSYSNGGLITFHEYSPTLHQFEFVDPSKMEPQMDSVELSQTNYLSSTNSGYNLFGEKFNDIKDYMRRYQMYTIINGKSQGSLKRTAMGIDVVIPILPTGIDHNTMDSPDKYSLGGLIPYILNGFRFGRGSLRFRLTVIGNDNMVVAVQHRPEIKILSRNVKYNTRKSRGVHEYIQSGYATTMINTRINNVATIEIPYYNVANQMLLQAPNFSFNSEIPNYGLGELNLSIMTPDPQQYTILIHYCLGDDFRVSNFVGFSPMMELYYEADIEPQMFNIFNKAKASVTVALDNAVDAQIEIAEKKISSKIADHITNCKDTIIDYIVRIAGDSKQFCILVITNLFHLIHTKFSIGGICIALGSVLVSLGLIIYEVMDDFRKCLSNLLNYFLTRAGRDIASYNKLMEQSKKDKRRNNNYDPGEGTSTFTRETEVVTEVGPQGLYSDEKEYHDVAAPLQALLVCSIAGMCSFKNKVKMGYDKNIMATLLTDIKDFSMTANTMTTFFRNFFGVIEKLTFAISKKFDKATAIYHGLYEEDEHFQKWYAQSLELVNPGIRNSLFDDDERVTKLICCAQVGQLIKHQLLKDIEPSTFIKKHKADILSLINKLEKLEYELNLTKQSPYIGTEPLVISHVGGTGIGKSYISTYMGTELLNHVGHKIHGETVFIRNAGNAFWNNLKQQPILIYDDFLQMEGEPYCMLEISELMLIKSRVVFNPPQASIEDKNIKYNPQLVFLNCNKAWPHINNLAENRAWMRRRDLLVRVTLTNEEYRHNHNYWKQEKYKDVKFPHLRFSIYENSFDANAKFLPGLSNLTYEQYINHVKILFKQHYDNEKLEYNKMLISLRNYKQDWGVSYSKTFDMYLNHVKKLTYSSMTNQQQMDLNKIIVANTELMKKYTTTVNTEHDSMLEKFKIVTSMMYNSVLPTERPILDRKLITPKPNNFVTPEGPLEINEKKYGVNFAENFKYFDLPIFTQFCQNNRSVISENDEQILYRICKRYYDLTVKNSNYYFELEDLSLYNTKPLICLRNDLLDKLLIEYNLQSCDHHDFNEYDTYVKSNGDKIDCLIQPCYFDNNWAIGIPTKDEFKHGIFMNNDFLNDQRVWKTKKFNNDGTCGDKCIWKTLHIIRYLDSLIFCCYIKTYLEAEIATEFVVPKYISEFYTKEKDMLIVTSSLNSAKVQEMSRDIAIEKKEGNLLKRIFKGTMGFIVRNIKAVLGVLGFLSSILVAFYYMRSGGKNGEMAYETSVPKVHRPYSKMPKRNIQRIKNKVESMQPEMAREQQNVIFKKLIRNTMFITYTHKNSESVSTCRCLGIKGKYFIMLDHYIDHMNNFADFSRGIIVTIGNTCVRAQWEDFTPYGLIPDTALYIYTIPSTINNFIDITKFIQKQSDTEHLPGECMFVELVEPDDTFAEIQVLSCVNPLSLGGCIRVRPIISGGNPTIVNTTYKYRTNGKGKCGSCIISTSNAQRPILGVHFAGGDNSGFAQPLIAEDFDQLEFTLVPEGNISANPNSKSYMDAKLLIPTRVMHISKVDNEYAHHAPKQSKLVKSVCYEKFFKSTHVPPILCPSDKRFELHKVESFSPMLEGIKFHGYVPKSFEKQYLKQASIDYQDTITNSVIPKRTIKSVLTINDVVCGLPLKGYDGMELNTSEGYPLMFHRRSGECNKQHLFKFDDATPIRNMVWIDPRVTELIRLDTEKREKGIVPETIFVDCYKDKCVKKTKEFTKGSVRIFSISPVQYTIAFRQYFLDFMVAFQQAGFKAENAIGINKDSIEWTELADVLLSNNDKIVTGDYSKFGPTLMAAVINECTDIICNWYSRYEVRNNKRNNIIRRCLMYEVTYSIHLCMDLLYSVVCGAPSGSPITTILNSMVNCLYIRTMWAKMNSLEINTKHFTMSQFRRNVKLVTYGDDLIMSVSDDAIDVFNCNILSQLFELYDISFTDSTKSGNIAYGYLFDENTTFLKSNFIKHPYRSNIIIHKLDITSVEEIGNYIIKTRNDIEVTQQATASMLLSMFGHGKEKYDELKEKICQFWAYYPNSIILPSYYEEDQRMFGEKCENKNKFIALLNKIKSKN